MYRHSPFLHRTDVMPPKKVKKAAPKISQVDEKPARGIGRSKKKTIQPSSPQSSPSSSSPSTSSGASSTASALPPAGSRAGGSQSRSPSPPPHHRGDCFSSPHAGSHTGVSQSRSPSPYRDSSVGSTASTSSQQPKTKKRAKKTPFSLVLEKEQIMLEFLQDNPVLWNCKMADYRRSDKKGELWEDQAALMGKTSAHLQGWFKSLRDTHTRLDKKKSGDGAFIDLTIEVGKDLTQREQWIKDKFGFLKSVVRHRPEPCNSVKATIDAHEGDLDTAEAACAELEIGLGDDDIMPPPTPRVPKGKRKRTQYADDALLADLQKRVKESSDALKDLQTRQQHQQLLTERTTFANYVRDSLVTISTRKFKKARSSMNQILSQLMEEDSDTDDTPDVPSDDPFMNGGPVKLEFGVSHN